MPEITLTYDARDAIAAFADLERQMPYVASVALNSTANDAQKAIRANLPGKFTLRRREFMERTIYRRSGVWPQGDNASKAQLTAAVRIHPQRDQLAKFEEGGQKQPTSGSTVAIPIPRLNNPNMIIRRSDPMHLSKLPGSLTKSGRTRTKSKLGLPVFAVTDRQGRKMILMNVGSTVRTLYVFQRSVPIPATLGFRETAVKVIGQRWTPNVLAALDKAIKTSR